MTFRFNTLLTYIYSLLLVLTPLAMYSRTSEIFEFNKLLIIYIITGVLASLWIARMLLARKIILRNNIFMIPLGLFLVSQILSTAFSIDVWTSIFGYYGRFNGGLLSIISYVLLFMIFVSNVDVSSSKTVRKTIETILKFSIVGSFIVMVWGLPSKFGYDLSCFVFTGNLDVACWTAEFQPTIRVFSTLGQPNWLGAYLAIHIFIGTYFYMISDKKKDLILYGSYIAFAMIMLLFTRSRSALLAVFISGIVYDSVIYLKRKDYFSKELRSKYVGIAAAIILPIIIIGTGIGSVDKFIHPWSIIENSQSTESDEATLSAPADIQESNITGSGEIRKIVWQGAYALGIEYPLFGTGVETFAYSYNFLRPFQHNATSEWNFVYNKAHNEFYNYFATTGAFGLLTYGVFIGIVLLQLQHVLKGKLSQRDELLVLSLITAYITILVTNFFGFSTTTISIFTYLIPALLVVHLYSTKMKKFDDSLEVAEKDLKTLAIPGAICVLIVWFMYSYFRADISYATGNNLRQSQEYDQALINLYDAFNVRPDHVYAEKISQVLAQQAFLHTISGENVAECLDRDASFKPCIDLSEEYMHKAIEKSSFNANYYRTKARNNFLFYQITEDSQYIDNAVAAVMQARELAPTDPRHPYLRALIALGYYETLSKPTENDTRNLENAGLGSVEFAIKLKDDYTDAYYLKGVILEELGNMEEANNTYQFIIDNLDPSHEGALQELQAQ